MGEYVMRIFEGTGESANEAGETNIRFTEMNGIDAFIPVVTRREMTDPIICVDVSETPSQYLPIPKSYFDAKEDPQVSYHILCVIDIVYIVV